MDIFVCITLTVIWTFFLWSHILLTNWLWCWKLSWIWCQSHYEITDKNNNVSFEGLAIHTCRYTPSHREGAILQSPCPSVRPSVHTFVTDISASTGRNDFIFDIWLWHNDLYRVSPFQVYRTSASCLLCDLQMNEWGYS